MSTFIERNFNQTQNSIEDLFIETINRSLFFIENQTNFVYKIDTWNFSNIKKLIFFIKKNNYKFHFFYEKWNKNISLLYKELKPNIKYIETQQTNTLLNFMEKQNYAELFKLITRSTENDLYLYLKLFLTLYPNKFNLINDSINSNYYEKKDVLTFLILELILNKHKENQSV